MSVRTGVYMGSPGAMLVNPLTRTGNYIGNPPSMNSYARNHSGSWLFQIQAGFIARMEHPMQLIPVYQSTAITVPVFMRDANTDRGMPGLTSVMVVTSKPSGSGFGTISPTITDRGNGWYDLALTSGMVATLGLMPLRITAVPGVGQPAAQENDEITLNVIAINNYDGVRAGLTALPNANAGQAGGLSQAVIRGGTAQGPGTGPNQIQLDAGASSTDNLYNRHRITIISNTGAGQSRFIISYVGSTKTATLGRNWTTAPDNTSVFEITQDSYNILSEGLAQAGGASSVTLSAASSSVTNFYAGVWIHIISGTGAGQSRLCTAYNGSTKVATLDEAWATQPDSTSGYQILTGADVNAATANVTEWQGAAPNNLTSGLVNANVAGSSVTANVNVTEWLGGTPGALDGSGNVPANVQALSGSALTSIVNAILNEVLSNHATAGTVGDAIAVAQGLLQGNFFMDEVNNTNPDGQTACRMRIFRTNTAAAGATSGGSGEGEFATFNVTTTYSGQNMITTHRVVRQ